MDRRHTTSNPQLNNGNEHSSDGGPQTDEEKYPSASSNDVRSDWHQLRCYPAVVAPNAEPSELTRTWRTLRGRPCVTGIIGIRIKGYWNLLRCDGVSDSSEAIRT
jgi:hypothetical protein